MPSFDITDLISQGIQTGVQSSQFNRDLTAKQRASEQLAQYRNDTIQVQLEELAESRRAAGKLEQYRVDDIAIRREVGLESTRSAKVREGNAADAVTQRTDEFEADLVTGMYGKRITSRASQEQRARHEPMTTITIGDQEFNLPEEQAARIMGNIKVAGIYQSTPKPAQAFNYDKMDFESMSPEDRARWTRIIQGSGQPERNSSNRIARDRITGQIIRKIAPDAVRALTRINEIDDRLGTNTPVPPPRIGPPPFGNE